MSSTMLGLLRAGGWAPLAVFAAHVVLDAGFDVYDARPWLDIPMHVLGGVAVAFFLSGCVRKVALDALGRGRAAVLELILVVSLTATTAALWELAEFVLDRSVGTRLQLGLPDTMKDLALGLVGASIVCGARLRLGRVRRSEVREVFADWRRALRA